MKRRQYQLRSGDGTWAINFDNIDFTMNECKIDPIEITLAESAGVSQYGSTINYRKFGTRDVTITGFVLADNPQSMNEKKGMLNRLASPLFNFYLVIDDTYQLELTSRTTVQYESAFYLHNEFLTKFTIEAVASMPFFTNTSLQSIDVRAVIPDFHFEKVFPQGQTFIFGYYPYTRQFEVQNVGDVPVGAIYKITTHVAGNPIQIGVRNYTTGDSFIINFNQTLTTDQEIIFDTRYSHKTLTLVDHAAGTETNIIHMLTDTSEFMELPAGSSYLELVGEVDIENYELFIDYEPLFTEV
jgi:hypothetical protein